MHNPSSESVYTRIRVQRKRSCLFSGQLQEMSSHAHTCYLSSCSVRGGLYHISFHLILIINVIFIILVIFNLRCWWQSEARTVWHNQQRRPNPCISNFYFEKFTHEYRVLSLAALSANKGTSYTHVFVTPCEQCFPASWLATEFIMVSSKHF